MNESATLTRPAHQPSTTAPVRVLLVDSHPLVRGALRRLFESTPDLHIVAEADSAAAALRHIDDCEFDLVVVDADLPDASALETVGALRRRRPRQAILAMSGAIDTRHAVELLHAGVGGFFPSCGEAEELLQAARAVAAGQRHIDAALAQALALEALGGPPTPRHRLLSARELEIFGQLAAGHTVSEIALALGLSVKTISTYRSRILEKMQLTQNAQLTAYAFRHHLMS